MTIRARVLFVAIVAIAGFTATAVSASGVGEVVVVKSALARGIPDTDPDAYWTLEGHAPTSQVATVASLTQAGQIQWATQTGNPAAAALPDFTGGGSLVGALPNTGTTNEWRLEFVARFGIGSDTIGDADFTVPVRVTSPSGTVNLWEVLISTGTAFLQWSNTSGSFTDLMDSGIAVDDGQWHHFRIDVEQSGADIIANITVDGDAATPETITTQTLNALDSTVGVNPDSEVAAYVGSVGHLTFWAPYGSATDTTVIATGHNGEIATTRFSRLCDENNVESAVST